jgi:hypothetical protein
MREQQGTISMRRMGGQSREQNAPSAGTPRAAATCVLVVAAMTGPWIATAPAAAAATPRVNARVSIGTGRVVTFTGTVTHTRRGLRMGIQVRRGRRTTTDRTSSAPIGRAGRFVLRWRAASGHASATVRPVVVRDSTHRVVATGRFVQVRITSDSSFVVPPTTRLYAASDVASVGPGASEGQAVVTLERGVNPPPPGGGVALGPVPNLPDGMFARVLAVKHAAGGTRLVLRQAAIDEVLDGVRVNFDQHAPPSIIDADGRVVSTTRLGAAGKAATVLRGDATVGGVLRPRAVEPTFLCTESGGLPRSADALWTTGSPFPVELKIENPHTVHQFDAGSFFPHRDPFLLLQFSGEAVASVSFQAKTGFKCALSPTFRRNHRLHFHVGSIVGIPVSVNLEPTLSFEVSAAGKIGISQRHFFSMTLEKRGFADLSLTSGHSSDPPQVALDAALKASLFAGGDLSIMAGGGFKSANAQAGLFGAFGPDFSLSTDAAHPGCVTGKVKLKADFGVRLELWVKRWNLTAASLSGPETILGEPVCGLSDPSAAPPPAPAPNPNAPGPPGSILIYGDGDFGEDTTGFINLEDALAQRGFAVATLPGTTTLPADLSAYGQIWHYGIDVPSDADQQRLIGYVHAGGRVLLTGERPCCELENDADSVIVNAVVAGGGIGVGGLGEIGLCTDLQDVNPSAQGGAATTPNVLTTWQPQCPGGMTGVAPQNVLATALDGTVTGAVWDETNISGGGRLAILMDVNWAQSTFADFTTMGPIAQNLAAFLGHQ